MEICMVILIKWTENGQGPPKIYSIEMLWHVFVEIQYITRLCIYRLHP